MKRIRQLLAPLLAMIAAAAMVFAPLLLAAHRADVQHARCAAHGELVELTADLSDHQDHHDPVIVPDVDLDHDSHCTVDQGTSTAWLADDPATPDTTWVDSDAPVLLSAAPRGPPPLSFAPKTSPPSCA